MPGAMSRRRRTEGWRNTIAATIVNAISKYHSQICAMKFAHKWTAFITPYEKSIEEPRRFWIHKLVEGMESEWNLNPELLNMVVED